MSFEFQPEEWDGAKRLQELSQDYARAKAAERELVQMRKVMWLLLKTIGEPVVVDRASLLGVPDDAEICEVNDNGTVTLQAI